MRKAMIPSTALLEVRKVFDLCRRRFPTIDLPFEAYLGRIEEVLSTISGCAGATREESWTTLLPAIQHQDLFLATACARGDRIAWEYFADRVPALVAYAARICRNAPDGEDTAHRLIASLLEDKSKIGGYNGLSSLAAWLRAAAAHAAVDRFRRAAREVPLDEMDRCPAGSVLDAQAPEELVDSRWVPTLCRILTEHIRRLPARDRLMLSLYYLHEVPLRAIGRHFGVHEATASRWLDRLRSTLRKSTERELRVRHRLTRRETASLWEKVGDTKEFSLAGAVGDTAGEAMAGDEPGVRSIRRADR
jgi:RNA polymerase sigma-70 factor, ECF subfamily